MKIDLSNVKSMMLVPGKCNAKIMSFVEKSGKNEGVKFFNIEFKILTGENKGLVHYDSVLFAHENEKAVNIGLGKIKSILKALSIDDESFDTETSPNDLLFLNLCLTLKVQKDKEGIERIVVAKYEAEDPSLNPLSDDQLPF